MKLDCCNWFCKCAVSAKIFEKDRTPHINKDKYKLKTQRFGVQLKKIRNKKDVVSNFRFVLFGVTLKMSKACIYFYTNQ